MAHTDSLKAYALAGDMSNPSGTQPVDHHPVHRLWSMTAESLKSSQLQRWIDAQLITLMAKFVVATNP
jgi:hypothetical protein